MSGWIDYKKLKETANIQIVLDHYHLDLKTKGKQATGFCPLPTHEGNGNSPSFSVNLAKGIFRCFGCGAKGNVIDLVAYMEGLNPADKKEFRTAAGKLQAICGGTTTTRQENRSKTQTSRKKPEPVANDALINAPLDFELKGLDPTHPYLLDRGFTEKTIEHFGLGYCSRGYMRGRIAIPLHDAKGDLIGYAGRIVDDSKIDRDNPRYLFPTSRQRGDVFHEFRKADILYNGNKISKQLDWLIVVQDIPSVWWLWQHGIGDVVALMDWDISSKQGDLLVESVLPTGSVCIFTNGNSDGESCAHRTMALLAIHRRVFWRRCGPNKRPTDYHVDKLTKLNDH